MSCRAPSQASPGDSQQLPQEPPSNSADQESPQGHPQEPPWEPRSGGALAEGFLCRPTFLPKPSPAPVPTSAYPHQCPSHLPHLPHQCRLQLTRTSADFSLLTQKPPPILVVFQIPILPWHHKSKNTQQPPTHTHTFVALATCSPQRRRSSC